MSEKRGKFMIRLLEFEAFSQACTGKSLSEDLLFADHGENILCTEIVLNVKNNFCTQHVLSLEFSCIELVIQWTILVHIVDVKIRASDKDLPVQMSTNLLIFYRTNMAKIDTMLFVS